MHPDSAREDEGLGFRATAPRLDQRVDRLPVLGDAVRRVLEGRMDEHGALSGDIGVRLGIPQLAHDGLDLLLREPSRFRLGSGEPPDAIAAWPATLRGAKPPGQPFTPWRLLEHIRISQWDIVEFTKSAKHVSPEWPAGYWPQSDAPPDAAAWDKSVAQVEQDLRAMQRLVRDPATDLFGRIPHGTGQTALREALVLADHNSYHVGQLVLLRRLLGAWKGD